MCVVPYQGTITIQLSTGGHTH